MTRGELIAELEKAGGPNFVLEVAIRDHLYPERGDRFGPPKNYTCSIDAALTLVPDDWSWRVGNLPSGKAFADLGAQRSLQCIEGATPAIALCIAALKARQEDER